MPSGRRWAMDRVVWLRMPIITVASHNGIASAIFIESWVVGVKVYGRIPAVFSAVKNNSKVVRIVAHTCALMVVGDIRVFVVFFINKIIRAVSRSFFSLSVFI